MINLKEQEAINYLSRVYTTLEVVNTAWKSNADLLRSMVDLERLYLERLLNNGISSTVLSIGASGFPDLESWLGDLERILSDYNQIKATRAKAVLPIFDQLSSARTEGILEQGENLAKMWQRDYAFIQAVGQMDQKRIDLLSTAKKDWLAQKFLFTYPNSKAGVYSPSVLLSGKESTDYKSFGRKEKYFSLENGYKYIDAKESCQTRVPFCLYISFYTDLSDRLFKATEQNLKTRKFEPMLPRIRDNRQVMESKDNEEIEQYPEKLQRTLKLSEHFSGNGEHDGTFLNALIRLDTTSLLDLEIDLFYQAMAELASLKEESKLFLKRIVEGALEITPAEINKTHQYWSSKLTQIFDSLPSNLKLQAQTVWAEAMRKGSV